MHTRLFMSVVLMLLSAISIVQSLSLTGKDKIDLTRDILQRDGNVDNSKSGTRNPSMLVATSSHLKTALDGH